MKAYCYSDKTGEYLGEHDCQANPLEPGEFLIPANSTDIPIPEYGENQIPQFVDGKWKIVSDFRGVRLWDTKTGHQAIIEELGKPADGMTEIEPDCPFPKWSVEGWETDAAAEAEFLLIGEIQAHENYLNSTDWYVVRMTETGKPIPPDIIQARRAARDRISELKA